MQPTASQGEPLSLDGPSALWFQLRVLIATLCGMAFGGFFFAFEHGSLLEAILFVPFAFIFGFPFAIPIGLLVALMSGLWIAWKRHRLKWLLFTISGGLVGGILILPRYLPGAEPGNISIGSMITCGCLTNLVIHLLFARDLRARDPQPSCPSGPPL